MPPPQPPLRLDRWQKTLPNAFLLAIFAALGLDWLVPIVGAKGERIFWHLTFTQDRLAAWVSVALLVFAALLARFGPASWPRESAAAEWLDRRIGWVAAATLPFYALLALGVSHRFAFASDEYSVLLQSQIFASGHLAAQVPVELVDSLVPRALQGFAFHLSPARGEWTSSYWPGFALLLTPFTLLGVPWLCNPVLTSLSIWMLHRVTRALTPGMARSPQTALWATVFALTSPVIALSAATYYSTPAHLLFNLVFCRLLLFQTRRAALGAGLVGSWALVLHNPIPHALFALPWIVWVCRYRRDLLVPLLGGYCFCAPLLGLGWNFYLNSFDMGSYAAVKTAAASRGAFLDLWERIRIVLTFPSRDLWLTRGAGMCKLLVWATPGLGALIAAARTSPDRDRTSPNHFLPLLGWSFAATFAGYLFVSFDQGAGWGFRYVHSAWMVLPIFGALALASAPPGSQLGGVSLRRFWAWSAALSLSVLLPLRCWQIERFLVAQRAQIPGVSAPASLTFIDVNRGYYTSDLVRNDPFLRASYWNLVHRSDAADARLARRFLQGARLSQSGKWGQIWVGEALIREFSD